MAWISRKVNHFLPKFAQEESSQTILGLHDPQEGGMTLFGLHEPLNEEGYQHVQHSGDKNSMESFLRRLLQSEKHELLEIIPYLAEMCSKEKKDFKEVLSILGHDVPRGEGGQGPDSTLGFSETTNSLSAEHTLGAEPVLPSQDCQEAATMPLHSQLACLPFEPATGSACGGFRLQWLAKPAPLGVWLGGRPCAPLREGFFVTPCGECGSVDVVAVFPDTQAHFPCAFSYWEPGVLQSITPSHGAEGAEVKVVTSYLGGEISEISLGGQKCTILGRPSTTDAQFVVPPELHGPAELQISATNGNWLSKEAAFTVMDSVVFGQTGNCVEILGGGASVRRTSGVINGICLSAKPVRSRNMERRFSVRVEEMNGKAGLRALAVGFATLSSLDLMPNGEVRPKEASDLARAWLVGYDRGGALLCSPKSTRKLPPGTWRPATDLEVGSSLEIRLRQDQLLIYQDGKERACLPVPAEDGPGQNEELHAVLDLQGAVSRISLASPMDPR